MRPSLAARRLSLATGVLGAVVALACGRREPPPAPPAPAPAEGRAAGEPGAAVSRVERDGLSIAFELRPLPGAGALPEARSDATAVFTITDAATGAPARDLSPLAWMTRRAGAPPDDAGCQEKIKSFMGGLIAVRPDVDMNAHLLWTQNDDNTLSVINPQLAFNRSKLRSLVTLAAGSTSVALHPDGSRLYATLQNGRGLAVVDTRRSLVAANVLVGADPMRVAVAPDGRTVWVGNDGDGTVSVVDARAAEVLKTLHVGAGHHEIAFSDGGRTAWITSRDARVVTAVDTGALEPVAEIEIGEGAAAVAASDAAGAVYVANEPRGEIAILDAGRRALSSRIAVKPGVSAIQFAPSGRFAFALNPAKGEVSIVDASVGALAHTLAGFASPDAIAFTKTYAYVRHLGESRISLIELPSLERPGKPAVVEVAVGQLAPRAAKGARSAAPFAPLPEGNGAIVASPADKGLYYYVEGMMAPMGTLSNYGREPRAALIEDRSLKEVEPGVYATTVRLGDEGAYDVELLLGGRRVAACLEATVAPSAAPAEDRSPGLALEPLFDGSVDLEVAKPATLRFRATAKAPAPPLEAKEMKVMIFRFPVGFREIALPRAEPDGAFSVTFTPPEPGQYRFLLAAESRNAPLGALPFVDLHAAAPAAGGGR
ncbi:cytochrome D1 domain-containing protein [Sorangium sp. So ce341]|uniref:cytochrome D1 domain-containing protein n=1 Tax=Sorangium sp. So ce341 TaxID=3133302 RepID=UPI003F5F5A43